MSNAAITPGRPIADAAAVIVNRDGGEALFRALASCREQRGPSVEIVVIDNGSRPAERERVARDFPGVRVVSFSRNRGFAAGANEGIARTRSPFVLLLNNDAWLEPDYLDRLLTLLVGRGDAAAAQGLVLSADGERVDSAGFGWTERGEAVPLHFGEARSAVPPAPFEVAGISATAALYRREAIEAVAPDGHFFDEDFFAYYEDVDASLRLISRGYRLLCEPGAIARHEGSRTGRRTPLRRAVWTARNRWATLRRHYDVRFLRRRAGGLLRADVAHARRLGLGAGAFLLLRVWPRALATLAFGRSRPGARTDWPAPAARS
jgi:GT2 family glycosyltransferase